MEMINFAYTTCQTEINANKQNTHNNIQVINVKFNE